MNKYILPLFFAFAGNASGQSGALFYASGANLANPAAAAPGNNPANPGPDNQSIGFWSQSPFTGTLLFSGGCFGHFKHGSHSIAFATKLSGTVWFMRQNAEISDALGVAENLDVGFACGWQQIRQNSGYPPLQSLTAKIGVHCKPGNQTEFACVISNPWLSNEKKAVTSRADLSAGIKLDKSATLYGQMSVVQNEPSALGLAVAYAAGSKLRLNAALQSGYIPVSAGVEFSETHFRLSLATQFHRYLGFSPAICLLWH